jgi:hypothetical protein
MSSRVNRKDLKRRFVAIPRRSMIPPWVLKSAGELNSAHPTLFAP